jgi:hypothetical protein
MYAMNTGASDFIKEALQNTKRQIGPDTKTVDDFNTQFSSKDTPSCSCYSSRNKLQS